MTGEVLLIIDNKVSDVATFTSQDDKRLLVRQFLSLKQLIETEHPYSTVRVDIRETNKEG